MAKTKKWLSDFDEIKILGEGGNAPVYLVCEKETGNQYALKELGKRNEEKKSRFLSEIQIASENAPIIPGILPVIKADCENYWYTMPVATQIMGYIKNKSIMDIVSGVIQLSETLEQLHAKEIHHRDIKPENVYYHNQRFSFGDFGLVDFPDNPEFTKSDHWLGAIFTIAPEMLRNPKIADASKADVYSLAKTLWMFLCDDNTGFDGTYNHLDDMHSLRYRSRFSSEHIVEIEELLKDATENNPNLRPDIKQFRERLLHWVDVYSDFEKAQNSDWEFLKEQLFGNNVPDSCEWRRTDQIINVLNTIGKTPAYNHMLFSDKGGLDFAKAEIAAEEGCIYIYDTIGICYVVSPKSLKFEGFSDDYRWSYFLLSLKELDPILGRNHGLDCELLVEDVSGHYVDSTYAQYGVYDYDSGEPLPDGYKEVSRYYHGKFLIVLKNGPYNHINGTYDGRHGMCDSDDFRDYIERIKKMYDALKSKALTDPAFHSMSAEEIDRRILHISYFNENPFEKKQCDDDMDAIERGIELEKKCKEFISGHYKEWNFSSAIDGISLKEEPQIKYYFEFCIEHSQFDIINPKSEHLCCNGYIQEEKKGEFADCYYVCSREDAIEVQMRIKQIMQHILEEEGLTDEYDFHEYFSIVLLKSGAPTHLFTKSEIEEAMKNADDRYHNQLVITEDGRAQVIHDEGHGTLYPVRCESWDAGNNYVGKYSSLSTLDEDYIRCLQGWLAYLKTGTGHRVDYIESGTNETALLAEIKEFYQ